MTKIEELKAAYVAAVAADSSIDQAFTEDQVVALTFAVLPQLLEAVELLSYASDVFADACSCGECFPCQQGAAMARLLEKLR